MHNYIFLFSKIVTIAYIYPTKKSRMSCFHKMLLSRVIKLLPIRKCDSEQLKGQRFIKVQTAVHVVLYKWVFARCQYVQSIYFFLSIISSV